MQFLEQQYMQMINQDMMATQFERMQLGEPQQPMIAPTNYFQHL